MTFLVIVTILTLSAFQVIVCAIFFVNSAVKNKLSLGCHSLNGVTRGSPPSPPAFSLPSYWRHCWSWRQYLSCLVRVIL